MRLTKDKILTEALSLKPRERELLAEELYLSLDGKTKDQIHDEWAREIKRRLEDLDQGKAKLVPADQAIREAREALSRQRRRRAQ